MPISRLSEDILLEIFLVCSEYDWDGHWPGTNPDLDWDWIIVTHVCTHWRNLALSSPILWCRPGMARHSHHRFQAFLKRSQEAPLTIHTYPSSACGTFMSKERECEKCTHNVLTALLLIHRIRCLVIHNADRRIISALLDLVAPSLEELKLISGEIAGPQTLIPYGFLSSGTPSLKSLVLCGFHLNYNCGILQGLERLEVDDHCQVPYLTRDRYLLTAPCYPTVDELLDLLVLSPNLIKLSFFTIQESAVMDARHNGRRVNMPNLMFLDIEEMNISVCENILYCVGIPAFTDVKFGLRYTDISELPLILSILTFLNEFKRCDSLNLHLSGSRACGDLGTAIDGDIYSIQSSLSLVKVDENGRVVNEDETIHGEIAGMMTSLIRGSSWKHVTTLDLRVGSRYILDENQWRMLLDSFELVKTLRLSVDGIPCPDDAPSTRDLLVKVALLEDTLLNVLMLQSENANEGNSHNRIVLPHLTRLLLHFSSITRNSDRLIRCVRTRKEHSYTVQDLGIHTVESTPNGQQNPPWHAEVRQFVDHFKCHGH